MGSSRLCRTIRDDVMKEAPNFRHGGNCCVNCEYGCLAKSELNIMVSCDKYGFVPPGGVCDDWEED
jgi:hypothetical protein